MTTENRTSHPVRQLRLVVETEDYDAALTFYRDVLGLVEREVIPSEGDARITILEAGRATLELSNPAQVRMIDQVEADGRPSAKIRVAFEVEDAEGAGHGQSLSPRPATKKPQARLGAGRRR
jgi:catechol 2,3-dioxygenase-like lactoylglutathione lyase family enzyme